MTYFLNGKINTVFDSCLAIRVHFCHLKHELLKPSQTIYDYAKSVIRATGQRKKARKKDDPNLR